MKLKIPFLVTYMLHLRCYFYCKRIFSMSKVIYENSNTLREVNKITTFK